MKWIRVDKELPEESGRYLVKIKHKPTFVVLFYSKIFDWWRLLIDTVEFECNDDITHWMKIQPPEDE